DRRHRGDRGARGRGRCVPAHPRARLRLLRVARGRRGAPARSRRGGVARMHVVPRPHEVVDAAANVFDSVFHGGLADTRSTPAAIIEEAPQCTVYRYLVPDDAGHRELPVLLVPPLAAPAVCFDLRRGCSLVEHLLALGHPTYLVDYGEIGFSDRELGL